MFAGAPEILPVGEALEPALEAVPSGAGVYCIWPHTGVPYLGKTGLLRRRLKRLHRIAATASRVEYWPVGSRLESSLVLYDLARRNFPETYLDRLKFRMPSYVRLALSNPFPRLQVTSRITGQRSHYYGPFRTRATAEAFEQEFLDLFQLRRCLEDLRPSADHPGCMYGEMGMCLRPCQGVVSESEYAAEVSRVVEFLQTEGRLMIQHAEAARDRLSREMQFEEAAHQHKRVERIDQILKLRDELVRDVDRLHGIAVTPSHKPDTVLLWFLVAGLWQPAREFRTSAEDQSTSMDRRLKRIVAGIDPPAGSLRERDEHLAILASWYYSSWRDGDWVPCESFDRVPYRRLVNAISRAARATV